MQNRVMKLRKRLSATQRGKSENETEKKKKEARGGRRGTSNVLAVLCCCCLLLQNPALRALPDMSKLRTCSCVRVCVCLIQLMHVLTTQAGGGREREVG